MNFYKSKILKYINILLYVLYQICTLLQKNDKMIRLFNVERCKMFDYFFLNLLCSEIILFIIKTVLYYCMCLIINFRI